MNKNTTDTNKRLDLLEEKVDLIMNKLGIVLEQEPKLEVIDNTNSSTTRLELQKTKNEIKVLKIKFRKIPAQSPVRNDTLKQIEELSKKQSNLEAELDESK